MTRNTKRLFETVVRGALGLALALVVVAGNTGCDEELNKLLNMVNKFELSLAPDGQTPGGTTGQPGGTLPGNDGPGLSQPGTDESGFDAPGGWSSDMGDGGFGGLDDCGC